MRLALVLFAILAAGCASAPAPRPDAAGGESAIAAAIGAPVVACPAFDRAAAWMGSVSTTFSGSARFDEKTYSMTYSLDRSARAEVRFAPRAAEDDLFYKVSKDPESATLTPLVPADDVVSATGELRDHLDAGAASGSLHATLDRIGVELVIEDDCHYRIALSSSGTLDEGDEQSRGRGTTIAIAAGEGTIKAGEDVVEGAVDLDVIRADDVPPASGNMFRVTGGMHEYYWDGGATRSGTARLEWRLARGA